MNYLSPWAYLCISNRWSLRWIPRPSGSFLSAKRPLKIMFSVVGWKNVESKLTIELKSIFLSGYFFFVYIYIIINFVNFQKVTCESRVTHSPSEHRFRVFQIPSLMSCPWTTDPAMILKHPFLQLNNQYKH